MINMVKMELKIRKKLLDGTDQICKMIPILNFSNFQIHNLELCYKFISKGTDCYIRHTDFGDMPMVINICTITIFDL